MPDPPGLSTAVPITGHVAFGALRLLVANTEKCNQAAFVKLKLDVAAAPEPVTCAEPGLKLMGVMRVPAEVGVALKVKLSMANN